MGSGIARFVLYKLFGQRNIQDAYRTGFEYAQRRLKANEGKPGIRKTVDSLMQEAYTLQQETSDMGHKRAEGIYAALADYRQDYGGRHSHS